MSWNLTQEWLCRENQQMPGFPVKATGTRKTCPGKNRRDPHKRGKARRYKGWTKKRRWRPKGRRYKGRTTLRAGEVGAAVADLVVAGDDFDFDGTVAIGGTAGIGVVAEAVLGAQLAVNA